jgi:hypothetical protein
MVSVLCLRPGIQGELVPQTLRISLLSCFPAGVYQEPVATAPTVQLKQRDAWSFPLVPSPPARPGWI